LICRKDVVKTKTYPLATKNPKTGQLRVGAAVSTHPNDRARIDALVDAGVDVLVIDSSQGNSYFQEETIDYIRQNHGDSIDIIGGNVVTPEQAKTLIQRGVDGLRVGMSSGSICTTSSVTGVGRGQGSAIYHVSRVASEAGIPIIADGGISNTSHIVKAFVLGASAVMMGSMLAACDESPGEFFYKDNVRLKRYRGMGSKPLDRGKTAENVASRYLDNPQNNLDKVFVAQGVIGSVISKGSLDSYFPYIAKAVKHGMQNIGSQSVSDLYMFPPRVELRTLAALKEGGIHDLFSHES
jgi:IMP dehydrogenase